MSVENPINNPPDSSSQSENIPSEQGFDAHEVLREEQARDEAIQAERDAQAREAKFIGKGKSEAQKYARSRSPFAWVRKRQERHNEQELERIEAERVAMETMLQEKLSQIDREINQAKSERDTQLANVSQLENRIGKLNQAIDSTTLSAGEKAGLSRKLSIAEQDLLRQKETLEKTILTTEMTEETLGWERAMTQESFGDTIQSLRKQSAKSVIRKQLLSADTKGIFNPSKLDSSIIKSLGKNAELIEDTTHGFNYISEYEKKAREQAQARQERERQEETTITPEGTTETRSHQEVTAELIQQINSEQTSKKTVEADLTKYKEELRILEGWENSGGTLTDREQSKKQEYEQLKRTAEGQIQEHDEKIAQFQKDLEKEIIQEQKRQAAELLEEQETQFISLLEESAEKYVELKESSDKATELEQNMDKIKKDIEKKLRDVNTQLREAEKAKKTISQLKRDVASKQGKAKQKAEEALKEAEDKIASISDLENTRKKLNEKYYHLINEGLIRTREEIKIAQDKLLAAEPLQKEIETYTEAKNASAKLPELRTAKAKEETLLDALGSNPTPAVAQVIEDRIRDLDTEITALETSSADIDQKRAAAKKAVEELLKL